MAKEIAEEYASSLSDLTLNSKPLINMLTMLADDNIEHAEVIVEAVEKHLEKVRSEYKLPVLYLIDSIVKNVGRAYTTLFTQNIVNTFCNVFEKVDEKVRAQMFKLRQTWSEVFPHKKMYTLDVRVQCIDPAWPIIAPPPTPNIHVNPKFFNKPNTPGSVPLTSASASLGKIVPTPLPMDSVALDMQTQLINKQKELLELKQKKLELELLQAKAKLEEQQKQLDRHTVQIKTPQQLLLKPEVAKQLSQSSSLAGTKAEDTSSSLKNPSQQGIMMQKLQNNALMTNSNSGPRIAPVNSALVASARDPRLVGKASSALPAATAPGAQQHLSASTYTNNSNVNNSVSFESVNLENFESKNKQFRTNKSVHGPGVGASIDPANMTHDTKSTVNKGGTGPAQAGALTRKDPRLKASGPTIHSSNNRSKAEGVHDSRPLSNNNKSNSVKVPPHPSRKSNNKTTRSFNNSNNKQGSSTKGTAVSSGKSDSSKSPIKYGNSNSNKKKGDSPRGSGADKNCDTKRGSSKNNKCDTTSANSNSKRSRSVRGSSDKFDGSLGQEAVSGTTSGGTAPASSVLPSNIPSPDRTFKEIPKGSMKNRNYMRRNRALSVSPEPSHDVDLRMNGPPEKQPRMQSSNNSTTIIEDSPGKSTTIESDSPANKDVDLRTLVVPASIGKKRVSTDKMEHSPVKKSKSEMFDVLFGSEDVDLRQMPPLVPPVAIVASTSPQVVIRPPTPPPPIISSTTSTDTKEIDTNVKVKEIKSSNPHFDAIRAKLANATKMSVEEQRTSAEDTDMRLKSSLIAAGEDVLNKIIISQADEQRIKTGNLSQALVEKVLTIFETQKLQEAQRRESEKSNDLANITLQPISDDDLSVDFSHSSDSEDDRKSRTDKRFSSNRDKDERVPPPAPVISQNTDKDIHHVAPTSNPIVREQTPISVDPTRLSTRSPPRLPVDHQTWRGPHRRRRPKTHWDSPPPGPEPWIRPPPVVLNQALYGPRRPFGFIRQDNFPRMEQMINPLILDVSKPNSPPAIGSQNTKELPLADPLVLEYIDQDTMRTINIDGRPREIRYYDETAIVIMSWDDPREISFQNGSRVISFDDKESFTLSFGEGYRDVTIAGHPHKIRLGAPTRELFIDGKWYECFFGGPGIGIELDGKMHVVKMEGPPPHVKIGNVKRTDLCAGKINLIINARQMVPVFLDAKPQKFDIEGKIHTLRFVDALRTVLINEVPFKVEFGGLPKPITVHDKKHFIRFSVLPRGLRPGYVNIANMEGQRIAESPKNDNDTDVNNIDLSAISMNEPALPMKGIRRPRNDRESPDSSRNSPSLQNTSQLGSLDVLSSIMTSPMTSSNPSGYQIDVAADPQNSQDSFPVVTKPPASSEIPGLTQEPVPVNPMSFLPANLNINELFQKLVSSGIVTSAKEPSPQPQKTEEPDTGIKPVLFTQPETLKVRQPTLVSTLYSGLQCSSCGVRFPPENSMQYSQHLDWHFRQNRKGKNSARKALCRKWYYNVEDWKNFEEIEDIEEREKNWFESQQQAAAAEGANEDGDEEMEIPSVPADRLQDGRCEVCHDKFDQFYNEEKEEWHLKMAIRVDDKTYHPLCYDDYKASLVDTSLTESVVESEVQEKKEEELCKEEMKAEEIAVEETEQPKVEETIEEKAEQIETKDENDDDMDGDVEIVDEKIDEIVVDDCKVDDEDTCANTESLETPIDIVDFANIRIKQEPMEDEIIFPGEELCLGNIKSEPLDLDSEEPILLPTARADNTHAEIMSSIDGNVQLDSGMSLTGTSSIAGKIKINITKPILAVPKESDPEPKIVMLPEPQDSDEPLPPGEEPVQLNLKPALQGLMLTRQPTVLKGSELTGMCSIM